MSKFKKKTKRMSKKNPIRNRGTSLVLRISTNPVIRLLGVHIRRKKDGIVITTVETYPSSSVKGRDDVPCSFIKVFLGKGAEGKGLTFWKTYQGGGGSRYSEYRTVNKAHNAVNIILRENPYLSIGAQHMLRELRSDIYNGLDGETSARISMNIEDKKYEEPFKFKIGGGSQHLIINILSDISIALEGIGQDFAEGQLAFLSQFIVALLALWGMGSKKH